MQFNGFSGSLAAGFEVADGLVEFFGEGAQFGFFAAQVVGAQLGAVQVVFGGLDVGLDFVIGFDHLRGYGCRRVGDSRFLLGFFAGGSEGGKSQSANADSKQEVFHNGVFLVIIKWLLLKPVNHYLTRYYAPIERSLFCQHPFGFGIALTNYFVMETGQSPPNGYYPQVFGQSIDARGVARGIC